MPDQIIEAPGEALHAGAESFYRAGYEAGLRSGPGVRCPVIVKGRHQADRERQARAWAGGYQQGCADRARGVTFVQWQQHGVKQMQLRRPERRGERRIRAPRSAPACPGDTAYQRPTLRAAYRRGYAAQRARKTLSDCPHGACGTATLDQLTAGLRAAWTAGFGRGVTDMLEAVQQELTAAAAQEHQRGAQHAGK